MNDLDQQKRVLLADIAHTEDELGIALHRLKTVTTRELDVGARIQGAPLEWIAGAFCVGLLLGLRSR